MGAIGRPSLRVAVQIEDSMMQRVIVWLTMTIVVFECCKTSLSGQADPPPQTATLKAEKEFTELYRLAEGQILKAIPFPETKVRIAYYGERPGLGVPQDSTNLHVFYRWRDKALAKNPSWRGGGDNLRGLVGPLLNIPYTELEGDARLLRTLVKADFIVREKAPEKEILTQFEAILRRDFHLPVKLSLVEADRPCVVVTGRYKYKSTPDRPAREAGSMDKIEVRAGEIGNAPDMDLNAAGAFDALLTNLSDHTGHRFLNEVQEGPGKIIEWHITAYSKSVGVSDERLEAILKNLSEETGLSFKRVNRKVRVLMVERTD
jgi:hypothetical protein